jgi:hypothetical protein
VMLDRRRLALAASYTRQAERLLAARLPRARGGGARARARTPVLGRVGLGGRPRARAPRGRAGARARHRETEALAQMDIGHSLLALGPRRRGARTARGLRRDLHDR